VPLDKYEVIITGPYKPKIIYLSMYDYEKPKPPTGFTFVK